MEPTPTPHEAGELEASLWGLVASSKRVLWLIAAGVSVVAVLALAGVVLLGVRVLSDERQIRQASCDQQATIAVIAIPDKAPKTLLSFVESSRKAFTVLHCPGSIGPIQPNLIRLGREDGIAVRY